MLGINSAFKAGFFNGASLAAEVETATLVSPTNNTTTRATVITDSSSATLSMGVRARLSDSPAYTTAQSMTAGGSTPVRATGKLMSAKVNVAAGEDWSFIRGVRFDEIAEGGGR